MFSLYVKEHNQSGLKYLGQTSKDPDKYLGSGLRWLRHLGKHGADISTYVIGTYDTKAELAEAGLFYSLAWDVAKLRTWANLKLEAGEGGAIIHTKRSRARISAAMKKRVADGLHPWIGGEVARKQNRERLENGTHNFLNLTSEQRSERGRKGGNNPNSGFHTGAAARAANGAGGRRCAELKKSGMYQKTTCPYCGIVGQMRAMGRWHFDNCKSIGDTP